MADQRSISGLALMVVGASLLAMLSAIQVGMGWPRIDRVVEKGLEQSAVWPL